ncbi:MAG: filamentation induced by cAMP protein fic [Candidatus Berkelbacteria bacterium Licking1014_85]|uniref:Filamentation induced by cAMP protein fic n=1 Tax=Candidatus Berkelbacteria bacterium Licking1014_85 TaxID=2017148 RepID=A0A554LG75_9BACT|nr:MAG: filamentation induced by cAMP protein fic [Candidatus Berkelbacteria bacterium Licking1014_85]
MRGLSTQKFADRDVQEVKGYYELLLNIFDSWQHIKFSESAIKHFHKELLKYADKDKKHKGEYKKQENKVLMIDKTGKSVGVLFDTTLAYLTPKEMQELVEWTLEELKSKANHPLLIIGNFLVEFLSIHPFADGNGRISRVLTNFLLLKQAVELLNKENIEKLLSLKQLAVWEYLNTVLEATPAEMSKNAKVARPTINQALDKLLRLKKIERIGLGRSTRYRKI